MSEIEYRLFEGTPTDEVLSWVTTLSQSVFGGGSTPEIRTRLAGRQHILACIAFSEGQPIGFKLGYMDRPHYFESWLGGVAESARRQGVADELMRRQHQWCVDKKISIVTTNTNDENTAMMILNLKHGFVVVGTTFDRGDHLKVFFQKRLRDKPPTD